MINSAFLHGYCDLTVDGKKKSVSCQLNLEDRRLICGIEPIDAMSSISKSTDQKYEVTRLELSTPDCKLTCSNVSIAFASNIQGGSVSVEQTPLGHYLGLNPQLAYVSFVINEPLEFEVNQSHDEVMFFPGFETLGSLEISPDLSIIGGKQYISIIGNPQNELNNLTICMSLAIGSPCRAFARQIGTRLTINLNNFGEKTKARSLFFRGYPYQNLELMKAGIIDIFRLSMNHIESLSKEEAAGFRNSVMTFLQVRSHSASFELQLYGAFHFLEWFDGSRTISPNILMTKLQITRKEADAIPKVRNLLAHNREDIGEVILRETHDLYNDPSMSSYKYKSNNLSFSFLNFLFSILAKALLLKIGYFGQADSYFPVPPKEVGR
jgi:hypothetical protein